MLHSYSFYSAYIIKWNFEIFRTGIRNLKGGKSKQEDAGKDRIFFFFWQGQDCSSSDKGTAALMTVEMDTEEGPQVRTLHSLKCYKKSLYTMLFGRY